MLERMEYVHIIYGHKVSEIFQYREHVEVLDSQNIKYTAHSIILALPWQQINDIQFHPPLPLELQRAPRNENKTKYVLTSFLASYREAYWQKSGYTGQYLWLEPFLMVHQYHNNTIYGHYLHEEGIEPLVKSLILHKLAEAFGEEMLLPLEYSQHTFELPALNHAPRTTPWNRVIWSSSASAGTCYRGLLGGAVQSGYRAAMNALLICRPQLVTWQDISEIQCSLNLPLRKRTFLHRWCSSWNLYGIATNVIFVSGFILVLRCCYKKH